jgi:hypothetical protein
LLCDVVVQREQQVNLFALFIFFAYFVKNLKPLCVYKSTMDSNIQLVRPGNQGKLIGETGEIRTPPMGWAFLPAGDAGVTRKVTAKGEYWRVQVKKGRRTISLGIWAPKVTIEQAKQVVADTRTTDEYQKKRVADLKRREKKQDVYGEEFCRAVEDYLNFHPVYKALETKLANAVTEHAIPVGSGTVARTQMIPIEERAAHAVIAWMRHKTTAYDNLKIARIKGERRAVRRTLAQQSVELLSNYRSGKPITGSCPLEKALR